MLSPDNAIALLNRVFEEEALVLGGLAATGGVSDDTVWQLVRSLDVIRGRTLRRLQAMVERDRSPKPNEPCIEPHPAIQEFLRRLEQPVSSFEFEGIS